MSFYDTAPVEVLAIIYDFKAGIDDYEQAQTYMTWRTYASCQEIAHIAAQDLTVWDREDMIWDVHTSLEQDMNQQIHAWSFEVQEELLSQMWDLLATETQIQIALLPEP